MQEINILTEWMSETKTEELPIYIYTMKITKMEDKHKENGAVIRELSRLNSNQVIVFYEQIIASFEEIKNWGEYAYVKQELRVININSNQERIILERLILRNIEKVQPSNEIQAKYGKFRRTNAIKIIDNIGIHPVIEMDVTISNKGDIVVGFDYTHKFIYRETLVELLVKGEIKQGDKVIDIRCNSGYIFEKVADFTVSQTNDIMNCSIFDYYIAKNQEYIINNVDPDTKAVLVKSSKELLPYMPKLLRKECTFKNLPSDKVQKISLIIKMNTDEKTKKILRETEAILDRYTRLKWNRKQLKIENLGYELVQYNEPTLRFGNNHGDKKIAYGLKKGGVYDRKTIEISYFLDPDILKLIVNKSQQGDKTVSFTEELEIKSKSLGIPIKRIKVNDKISNANLEFSDPILLDVQLKNISSNFENTTVVIATDSHIDNCYSAIKKEFGFKKSIPTQFIKFSRIFTQSTSREYTILNILLGIYAKAGIQPWILAEPLHADCFIGLDVSHEDKCHSSGIVQVIGKEGRVLASRTISSVEAGEKIHSDTLKEIITEAYSSYQKEYNCEPRHFTFHRDGRCFEDIDNIKQILEKLKVNFDYIEVTKSPSRRMVTTENSKTWKTVMGNCYIKDYMAYLCSTNPAERVGMAQPIKITKVHGESSMRDIVADIYNLSFMHIASLIKTRLPITTHYADLSSTYSNRKWMPLNLESRELHFV